MRQQHAGEDQVAIGRIRRIWLDFRQCAFEGHRSASHTRRRHTLAGDGVYVGVLDLADPMRQPGGGSVHPLGLGGADQMDHQFAGFPHIAQGVLEAAVVAHAGVDHQRRRLIADHLEKTERSEIAPAIRR
ncbi:hypothetical protein D3C81_1819650 [compost metagenome]